jgi:2,4-dienoyl-CoA reductase (NADPH2)
LPGADARCALSVDELRELLAGHGPALAGIGPGPRLLLRALRLVPALQRPAPLRRWTKLWLPLGRRVVVIGGGAVGVAIARFLADRGRRVTVLESGPWLAPELAIPRRWRALHELREQGVDLRTGVRVERISDGAVAIQQEDGAVESLPADHVILAELTRPDRALAEGLSGQPTTAFSAGDCQEIGYLRGAIEDGNRSGREI